MSNKISIIQKSLKVRLYPTSEQKNNPKQNLWLLQTSL